MFLKSNNYYLIFILISIGANAQNFVTINGWLKSTEDNSSIPFATIKLKSQDIYSISNVEGYFEFKILNLPKNDSVIISSVGFNTKRIAVNNINPNSIVNLEPSVTILSAVLISTRKKSAREIVEKAINQIENNYSNSLLVEGYFRKYQKIDDRAISFLDAAIELYDDQFAKNTSNKKGEFARVVAARKTLTYNEKGYTNWADSISNASNWLARLLSENDVRYRSGLLNTKNKYDSISFTNYDDKLCYEIIILKKPWHYIKPTSNGYKGNIKLIIGVNDYKIYKIIDEESTSERGNKNQFLWERKTNKEVSARIIGGKKVIEFKEVNNGKLVLNYISQSYLIEDYDSKTNKHLHDNLYHWEFYVNKVTDIEKLDKSSLSSKIATFVSQKRDDLVMNDVPYQSKFWETYNLVPFSKDNHTTLNQLDQRMPISEQFIKSSKHK